MSAFYPFFVAQQETGMTAMDAVVYGVAAVCFCAGAAMLCIAWCRS